MNSLSTISNYWGILKEADLRPLREQALRPIRIAVVGAPGSGRATLVERMRVSPVKPALATEMAVAADTPVLVLDLESAGQATGADLIILIMDARKTDSVAEQGLVERWYNSGQRVLVLINQFDVPPGETAVSPWPGKGRRRVIWGSVLDDHFLAQQFAPAVIALLPEHLLSLGRSFPLFRIPVAHNLINDACFSNAAYALSTGLAETIAIINIPLTIADMVILTKTQLFLVYKLGLALGYSTRWQDYVAEFGGVLGIGFVWRQLARTLIGLVPIIGIIPKVAVAYSGTYVVGQTVLQWCITGKHLSKTQIQALYRQAFDRGKTIAGVLLGRLPHPRLPKLRMPSRKPRALPAPAQTCPDCGKTSSADAAFCQYCGKTFRKQPDDVLLEP